MKNFYFVQGQGLQLSHFKSFSLPSRRWSRFLPKAYWWQIYWVWEGTEQAVKIKKSSQIFWSDQTGGRNPGTLAYLFVCFLFRVLFIFYSREAKGLIVGILTEAKHSVRADALQAFPYSLANPSQSSSGLPHFSPFLCLFSAASASQKELNDGFVI